MKLEITKIITKEDINITENRKTSYFYIIEGCKSKVFLAWNDDEHYLYEIDKISIDIDNIYYADKFTLDKENKQIKLISFYDKHADCGYGSDINVFALYNQDRIIFVTKEEGEKDIQEELGIIKEKNNILEWTINEDLFV